MPENTRRGLYVPLDVNYREDPKIIEAGAEAELVYLRSLVLAKRLTDRDGHVHRAHLTGLACDIDSVLRGESQPVDIAADLVKSGLWIEDVDGWLIAAWLKHNPSAAEIDESRGAEASRKRAWRESQRDKDRETGRPESRDEPSRGTEWDATDSKREEKTETETRIGPPSGGKTRGSRIPDEFIVSPEMVDWVRVKCPDIDWPNQSERFVNHWKSKTGKDAVKADWERTWRNWMLQAQDWTKNKSAVRTHL